MRDYLIATGRAPVARAADEAQRQGFLDRDEGAKWDDVVEIVSTSPLISFAQMFIPFVGLIDTRTDDKRPFHPRFGHTCFEIRNVY